MYSLTVLNRATALNPIRMNSTDVSAIPVTNSGTLNPDNGDMALIAVPVNSAREVRVITFEIRYSLILSGVIII